MWQEMLQEVWSNTPLLLVVVIIILLVIRPIFGIVNFIDVWRVQHRELTPADIVNGEMPQVFEGLGSRLLLYTGVDWGLLVIEHYGLWRRWHGATGRQKMKLTLASRLVPAWWFLPGLLCLERARDQGRLGNLGEVNAVFFTRKQEEGFRKADMLIHQVNGKLERKEPIKGRPGQSNDALYPRAGSDDTEGVNY
ncbi:MAG TPA: hypothetical protein VJ302_31565 [Blastocatellia bacterium]|nr:hypothetical protein [Blastocatellia bacterium]